MKNDFKPETCWYKNVCGLADTDRCDKYCIRFSQMKHLIESSYLPRTLCFPTPLEPQNKDLSAFVKLNDIRNDIVNFVNKGTNLYIYSKNTGNGKTTWASKLMLKYFEQIWSTNGFNDRGLFISVTDFLIDTKLSGYKDSSSYLLFQKIKSVDLVIWDDIAVSGVTAFDFELLYSLINHRVLNGLSNIFTGNLDGEKLQQILGSKLYSRIWNNSVVIEFLGEDRRS